MPRTVAKSEPATLEQLRLQVSLQQVLVKELESRVKVMEQRNSELTFAVNGLTAVIDKRQAAQDLPQAEL